MRRTGERIEGARRRPGSGKAITLRGVVCIKKGQRQRERSDLSRRKTENAAARTRKQHLQGQAARGRGYGVFFSPGSGCGRLSN